MTELRIRVKDVIKSRLEELKDLTGLSINYYVNYAIVKQLIMDRILKGWEFENMAKKDPHYENINKLPEDLKFCDGDRCEIDYNTTVDPPLEEIMKEVIDPELLQKKFLKGDKC